MSGISLIKIKWSYSMINNIKTICLISTICLIGFATTLLWSSSTLDDSSEPILLIEEEDLVKPQCDLYRELVEYVEANEIRLLSVKRIGEFECEFKLQFLNGQIIRTIHSWE